MKLVKRNYLVWQSFNFDKDLILTNESDVSQIEDYFILILKVNKA